MYAAVQTPIDVAFAVSGLARFLTNEFRTQNIMSVWGPSRDRSRLLYTAVTRPTMLYGAALWYPGTSKTQLEYE